jgi:hypothetical protein
MNKVGEQRHWDALCGAPDLPEGFRLAKLTLTAHRITKARVYWLSHSGETSWTRANTGTHWSAFPRSQRASRIDHAQADTEAIRSFSADDIGHLRDTR